MYNFKGKKPANYKKRDQKLGMSLNLGYFDLFTPYLFFTYTC